LALQITRRVRRHLPRRRPSRIQQWWEIVDELTDPAALVTSEIVPAVRATGPEIQRGGLRLAKHGH
jgi:hypothetical protein